MVVSLYSKATNILFIGSPAYFDSDTFEKHFPRHNTCKFECTYCGKKIEANTMHIPKMREKYVTELLRNATQKYYATVPSFLLNDSLSSQENDALNFQDTHEPIPKSKIGLTIA